MKNKIFIIVVVLVIITAIFYVQKNSDNIKPDKNITVKNPSSTMKITSSIFENMESLHPKYTCDDKNINPPLEISGVDKSAVSLVLIMDDPDAPAGTWTHWTVWNIDPSVTSIAEDSVPRGGVEGTTSFNVTGYGGPCPPDGEHRYYFRLYALDTILDLKEDDKIKDLQKALEGHVIDSAEIVGLYSRI